MIFLIEFNRETQDKITYKKYADHEYDVAAEDLLELELLRFNQGVQNEIVIMQAKDEEQLKRTHGRYFSKLTRVDFSEIQKLNERVAALQDS